jgi:hypothetical protein
VRYFRCGSRPCRVDSKGRTECRRSWDAAIEALVDALAELPEHELEGWQRGNRLGLRILCELGRRYPGIVQATGPVRRKSA